MEWKTANNTWLMDAATTWQQIIDVFVNDLNPVMGFNEDINVFTGAYQQASEPLAFYLDRMKRLYKKVAVMLTEAQAVSITLDNVYPAYRPHIETYNINTFKGVELRFRKAERFYQQSLTYQQPINNNIPQPMAYQQPTNNSVRQASLTDTAEIIKIVLAAIGKTNRDNPKICYYCDKIGHIATSCRLRLSHMEGTGRSPSRELRSHRDEWDYNNNNNRYNHDPPRNIPRQPRDMSPRNETQPRYESPRRDFRQYGNNGRNKDPDPSYRPRTDMSTRQDGQRTLEWNSRARSTSPKN
jgi:hypothetical protein